MIPEPVEGVDYHIAIAPSSPSIAAGTEVEVDAITGKLFDRKAWTQAKLAADGLNDKGEPLRPHEKTRPAREQSLFDYMEIQ